MAVNVAKIILEAAVNNRRVIQERSDLPIGGRGHVLHMKDVGNMTMTSREVNVASEISEIGCQVVLIDIDEIRQVLEVRCRCGEVIVVDCELITR